MSGEGLDRAQAMAGVVVLAPAAAALQDGDRWPGVAGERVGKTGVRGE